MMPVDMRLLTRLEGPLEDTPPSTRPSSSASSNSSSTSGLPHRSTSMDSIHAEKDKQTGTEYIPTRNTRIEPKCNVDAGRFIKTGPANLHLTAKQQLEKAAAIKAIRKPTLQEEEEWQSTPKTSFEDNQDWQAKLNEWKNTRRKMNEEAIERVIRVKENAQTTSHPVKRRTMRRHITTYDDDNNDISELLSPTIEMEPPTLCNIHQRDDSEVKFVDSDTKDAKSDPGFCTGSDTGSDGVFAEDSISDTSSALGDKKEAPDSLLDPPPRDGESFDPPFADPVSHRLSSPSIASPSSAYDKAIEDYKQFAENSAKKRTSSVTNEEEKREEKLAAEKSATASPAPVSTKISDKLTFFHSEMEKESSSHSKSVTRRNAPQVELYKRRSMFEIGELDKFDKKPVSRRSLDVSTTSLKNKVASFENISVESDHKPKGITPPRDLKFREKLDNFRSGVKTDYSVASRKAFANRDKDFSKKLRNFSLLETGGAKSPERKAKNVPSAVPLKERIASFERLSPEHNLKDRSVSMECLSSTSKRILSSGLGDTAYLKKAPSTPFMVVELDSAEEEEKACVQERITREYHSSSSLTKNEAGSRSSSLKRETFSTHIRTSSLDAPSSSPSSTYSSTNSTLNSTSSKLGSTQFSNYMKEKMERLISITKEQAKSDAPPQPERTEGKGSVAHAVRAVELVPKTDDQHPNTVEFVPKEVIKHLPATSKPKVEAEAPPPAPTTQPPPEPEPLLSKALVDEPTTGGLPEADVSPELPAKAAGSAFEEDDSNLEYGDEDIDEAIEDYEYLSSATTVEAISEVHLYEKASEMTTLMKPSPTPPSEIPVENFYENIVEEEPVYENIYEKVQDDNPESPSARPPSANSPEVQHHYQTLEDVKTEVENLAPPLPPKSKVASDFEVIDVTWTEEDAGVGGAPLVPPSVPPPPPPPEDDADEDTEGEGGLPSPAPGSTSDYEKGLKSPHSSSQNIKKEIRKKMSDFLGSSPHEDEEVILQPPPDVNELLRQERQSERLLLQKQSSLSLPKQEPESRPKYTWEDRMRDDGPRTKDLNESSDHLEFHSKLEELEREMVKHDLDMMHRAGASTGSLANSSELYANTSSNVSPPLEYREPSLEEPRSTNPEVSSAQSKASVIPPSTLPIQEFYTAPTFSDASPQSGYLASPSNATTNGSFPPPGVASAPYTSGSLDQLYEQPPPELVPRKKKSPVQFPQESRLQNHNLQESCDPSLRYGDMKSNGAALDSGSSSPSGQPLSKQSILALSAIPKPRLVDNDSWIMKRKPEAAGKRDYGKHWLIQEAEQRRIEQQDRLARQKNLPNANLLVKSPQSPPNAAYQSHYQNLRSSFNGAPYDPQPHPPATTSSSNPLPQSFSSSLPAPATHSKANLANNNWKKQTKTYQLPQDPPSQKPLPESIINTLTQRVTGKSKSSSGRLNGSLNSNYRSEDFHDYMNTEGLNNSPPQPSFSNPSLSTHGYAAPPSGGVSHQGGFGPPPQAINATTAPPSLSQHGIPYQSSAPPPHAPPPPAPVNQSPPQPLNSNEEQRLLSVSGKKKCSHCGEELGRGAAMIIESLRLFYHIPCFKCCVCSIQLGNGTSGADVRVRNHKLHCHNCYSNDEGMKFSKV